MPSAEPRRFRVDRDRERLTITFDDGGMNLLSRAALEELAQCVAVVRGQPAPVRVVALRSLRPSLFAAGADMNEMSAYSEVEAEALARLGQQVFMAIETLPMITVALIDGDCFGGALDLAMAFDLRLATPGSRFSHPGARLGIVTGYGGTSRWRKLLAISSGRSLLLGNEVIHAPEALTMGLIDRIGEDFEADLTRLALSNPASVALVKELTNRAPRLSQRELALLAERLEEIYTSR